MPGDNDGFKSVYGKWETILIPIIQDGPNINSFDIMLRG